MYQVSLKDLYAKRYSIELGGIAKELWCDGYSWSYANQNRRNSALLYVAACEIEYSYNNKIFLTAKPGDFLYLPGGAEYTCVFKKCDETVVYHGLSADFMMRDEYGEQIVISGEIMKMNEFFGPNIMRQIEELHHLYTMPEKPFPYICANLQLIMHGFALQDKKKGKCNPRFIGISKGIDYMENDPEQTKSVAEVAEMCPVSISCFNRLFKEYSGMTPIEYRYAKKIEQAMSMLVLDEESVKSVANALNFESPSYFARMFRKKTGMSPSEYRNKCLKNE
ncbi:MAG: helix-turn-helix transcriptional regulator [Clostridia bacterium]|nr:helix-turn-helix transcriptional regulator [Clostridia bacterium]